MAAKSVFQQAVTDLLGSAATSAVPSSAVSRAGSFRIAAHPAPPMPRSVSETSGTFFAPGASLEGKLTVNGNIEIAGDFHGTLEVHGTALIRSNIFCEITATQLELSNCRLTGDVHVSGTMTIDSKSVMDGRVYAGDLICDGRVCGDIQVTGNSTFRPNAKIESSISTGTMIVERGALIGGTVSMENGMPAAVLSPAASQEAVPIVPEPESEPKNPTGPCIRIPTFPTVSSASLARETRTVEDPDDTGGTIVIHTLH